MDAFWHDMTSAYQSHIEATGKELHFLVLVGFLGSFAFIRTSTHMIKAEVSWWPGNVETKGGTHIHHLVWGILLMLTMGYLGIAGGFGAPWIELIALAFGIGMGLTLDEFALWLNLQDVYWTEKGRQSIDAVIVTSLLLIITLLGLQFWIDVREAAFLALGIGGERLEAGESAVLLTILQLVGVAFAVVCILKGRLLVGLFGLFIPLVAIVGAFFKAKPDSLWARRRRRRQEHSTA